MYRYNPTRVRQGDGFASNRRAALEGLVHVRLQSSGSWHSIAPGGGGLRGVSWLAPLLAILLLALLLGAVSNRPCIVAALPSWLTYWLAIELVFGSGVGSRQLQPIWLWILRGFLLAVIAVCLVSTLADHPSLKAPFLTTPNTAPAESTNSQQPSVSEPPKDRFLKSAARGAFNRPHTHRGIL
jgi:hypothetical protein